MKIPKHVTDYIEKYKSSNVIFNKSALDLYLFEDNILQRDDLYFDDQK